MTDARLAIEIQDASGSRSVPEPGRIKNWVIHALPREAIGEITVRVVAEAEGVRLNEGYRHGVGPTNVLAFPAERISSMPKAGASTWMSMRSSRGPLTRAL